MNEKSPEIFETTIEKLVTGGPGLGRCEGMAAFVPRSAPGDRLRAQVTERKKNFLLAEAIEILEPGPDRQVPPCPHFGECGGCDWQHLRAPAQRLAKRDIVADCFRRLGKLEVGDILEDPGPAGPDLGYRNRIRLIAAPTGQYGLMRRGSHEVVPLETCLQLPGQFTEEILPWLRNLPPVEQIVLIMNEQGQFLLSVFGKPNRARVLKQLIGDRVSSEGLLPSCVGLLFNNLPLWGRDYLVMKVAGKKYRTSAQSFFQVNLAETEAAIATIGAWLSETRPAGGLLADLYCGVGLFSLALADRFDRVIAADADKHAVRDARNNVQRDGTARDKVQVHASSVARILQRQDLAQPGEWQQACCVLDPPRQGLGARVTAPLVHLAPRDMIIMSCDPATQARDVAVLVGAGYKLKRLQLVDMFPQTAHIETIVQLGRE